MDKEAEKDLRELKAYIETLNQDELRLRIVREIHTEIEEGSICVYLTYKIESEILLEELERLKEIAWVSSTGCLCIECELPWAE